VTYLEDTGQWVYSPRLSTFTDDGDDNVAYLARTLAPTRVPWAFRDPHGRLHGLDAGRVAHAWDWLKKLEPRFAPNELVLLKCQLLRLDLRFAEELEELEAARARKPWDTAIVRALAHALIDEGAVGRARDLLEGGVARMPAEMAWFSPCVRLARRAHHERAQFLAEVGRFCARVPPKQIPDMLLEHAHSCMLAGDFARAEALTEECMELMPKQPVAVARRAEIEIMIARRLLQLGRHNEAREIFDRLLRANPPVRWRDEILHASALNEARGGGDFERLLAHQNAVTDSRHHIPLTPFRTDSRGGTPPVRVAVLLHLYYTDQWPEFERYLQSLRGTRFQLFVSLAQGAEAGFEEAIHAFDAGASIRRVENVGFDMGSHWQNLDAIDLSQFDAVLLLHTKRNGHTRNGAFWRRTLIEPLLGSPERWRDNLWALADAPELGMIGSGIHRVAFPGQLVFPELRLVLEALGLPLQHDLLRQLGARVSGTMFLMRANLLAEMHARTRPRITFRRHEDMPIAFKLGQTYAHALEICFGLYPKWRGYRSLWRPC